MHKKFGAVATDMESGREVWFQNGSLQDAVRASIAMPGVLTPIKVNDRWLIDGGLSNPVPISLCRAMGADVIIAVNLNNDLVNKHINYNEEIKTVSPKKNDSSLFDRVSSQLTDSLLERRDLLLNHLFGDDVNSPSLVEVLSSSINIMQDQITRSRMAGDSPDILLSPRLPQIGLLDFDRASEIIEEGRACVERMRPALEQLINNKI